MPPPDSSRAAEVVSPSVEIGGLAYFDYAYLLSSDEPDAEGSNSFDYRRIYLTADYTLPKDFSGRVRLEAQGSSTTEQGRPVTFIKDAYVRWDGPFAEGHRLTLGVQSPPLFGPAERVWGYRSLAKTILDRTKANDSRDFGLRADGPLVAGGALGYAVMVANGNGLRPDPEGQRGKHVYGQLVARPGETFVTSLGADFTSHEALVDARDETLKVSAFAGAITDTFRGGIEAFAAWTDFEDPLVQSTSGLGVSVFGAATFGDDRQYSVVGRVDRVGANAGRSATDETFGLAAFVYRPIPAVEIMPNLVVTKPDGSGADIEARGTVHVRF